MEHAVPRRKYAIFSIVAIFLLILFLAFPKTLTAAAANGVSVCLNKLLPSLFPILFLTDLLMKSLGGFVSNKKALFSLSILFSFLGGFVCGAKLLADLIKSGITDKKSASYALCGMANAGPAFIVATVGAGLLENNLLGLLIYISLTSSSLLCLLVFRKKIKLADGAIKQNRELSPFDSLHFAMKTTVSICAVCIIAGCLLDFVKLILSAEGFAAYIACALFEVTSACITGAGLPYAPYLCLAASSVLSVSIFYQISSVLHETRVSLVPLLASRLIHLPLSVGIFRLLLIFCEATIPAAVYAPSPAPVLFSASPAFSIVFFLLGAAVIVREKA